LQVGVGSVRTGVMVVFLRGKNDIWPTYAGFYNLNGNGEMTGLSYIEDYGVIYGPIGLSNTNAVGDVYAGIQRWTSVRFGKAMQPADTPLRICNFTCVTKYHIWHFWHACLSAVGRILFRRGSIMNQPGNMPDAQRSCIFYIKGTKSPSVVPINPNWK